jgi:opacity protein-like surface antigen
VILAQFNFADDIVLGVQLGYRQIKDPGLNDIYGHGLVYDSYMNYFPVSNYGLEFAYEGGYKRDAPLGLFQEDSTLSISGFQLCGVLRYPIRKLIPFLKAGIGYFSYRQDIQSEFTRLKVDHHKWTTILGGGIRFNVSKGLFISAEIKHIPLKVQPFEIPVDLGGWRVLAGVGYRISL